MKLKLDSPMVPTIGMFLTLKSTLKPHTHFMVTTLKFMEIIHSRLRIRRNSEFYSLMARIQLNCSRLKLRL